MLITKRIERLYSLKEYENIKIVLEAQEEIGNTDPVAWYKRLWDMLRAELKKEAEIIKK